MVQLYLFWHFPELSFLRCSGIAEPRWCQLLYRRSRSSPRHRQGPVRPYSRCQSSYNGTWAHLSGNCALQSGGLQQSQEGHGLLWPQKVSFLIFFFFSPTLKFLFQMKAGHSSNMPILQLYQYIASPAIKLDITGRLWIQIPMMPQPSVQEAKRTLLDVFFEQKESSTFFPCQSHWH